MRISHNADQLRTLLESFYTVLNTRVIIFDNLFNRIVQLPEEDCKFCTILRRDPAANQACINSDIQAFEQCRQSVAPYSYVCHAGFVELVTPIRHGNFILGYMMFGQIIEASDPGACWEKIKLRCSKFNIDMIELYDAYKEMRHISHEQIKASTVLLEACAAYLWMNNVIYPQKHDLMVRLDEYIANNLDKDLSTTVLCSEFDISRSTLHRLAKECYTTTIEQAIRRLRIDKAKDLLENTKLTVSAVASQSGYEDYNYFIKVFKGATGITPLQYRKATKQK